MKEDEVMIIKYPRTPHLPWSEGATGDDRMLANVDHFIGKEVVVTEKVDGENTSMYHDYMHARSLDSRDHESRHWIKSLHPQIKMYIPQGWRFCGENMYATHSIHYEKLSDYFLLFSVWDADNICLAWNAVEGWADLLMLETVPVLYCGTYDEEKIKACYTGISKFGGIQEGYVVRLKDDFHYEDFSTSVAKFVRKNHVQTDEHWMSKPVVPNKLK